MNYAQIIGNGTCGQCRHWDHARATYVDGVGRVALCKKHIPEMSQHENGTGIYGVVFSEADMPCPMEFPSIGRPYRASWKNLPDYERKIALKFIAFDKKEAA